MRLIVEFLGPSRRLAQTRDTTLDVADRSTYRDVLREIARLYPSLVDAVILSTPHYDLAPAYMLNVDGRHAVADLDAPAEAGQRLIIMVLEAGG